MCHYIHCFTWSHSFQEPINDVKWELTVPVLLDLANGFWQWNSMFWHSLVPLLIRHESHLSLSTSLTYLFFFFSFLCRLFLLHPLKFSFQSSIICPFLLCPNTFYWWSHLCNFNHHHMEQWTYTYIYVQPQSSSCLKSKFPTAYLTIFDNVMSEGRNFLFTKAFYV